MRIEVLDDVLAPRRSRHKVSTHLVGKVLINEGSGHQDMERVLAINAVVGAIDSLVEKYDKEGSKVSGPRPFILGICCADIGNLPKEFVRVGRFEKLVTMDAPTQSQRELILKHMLQDLPLADVSNKETKGDKGTQGLSELKELFTLRVILRFV